jgi:hypothetical protein
MVKRLVPGPPPPPKSFLRDSTQNQDSPEFFDYATLNPALEALRASLGIEGDIESTVHVYVIDVSTKLEYKIWQGDADAFNLEALAKQHGSGQYRVKVYVRNADGKPVLQFNKIQGWRLSTDDETRVQEAKFAAANPGTRPHHNGAETRELMREMMAGFQETVAKLIPVQAAPVDPFAQFEKFASLMKSVMPAAAPPPGPDLSTLLGMMKTLKELTGESNASASEALMLKAADAFMPAIAEGLKAKPAPAAAAPGAPGPAQLGTELSEEEQMFNLKQQTKLALFQLQLRAANKAAARGIAPDAYADTIYDAFDEDDIQGIALSSNWFELMCQTVPDCKANEAWFFNVRTALIELAVEDGILLRDAAGALTLPPEEGTRDDSLESKSPNGTADAR